MVIVVSNFAPHSPTTYTVTQVSPTAPVYLNDPTNLTYVYTITTVSTLPPEALIVVSIPRVREKPYLFDTKFKKDLTFFEPCFNRKILPANKVLYCKVKKNKIARSK